MSWSATCLIGALLPVAFTLGCAGLAHAAPATPLRVAILADDAMAESLNGCLSALSSAERIAATTISGEAIRAGALADVDVLLLPGGSGSAQCRALGKEGGRIVEQRVAEGMGCIGVCAGGYALIRGEGDDVFSNVALVNADLLDGEHWERGVGTLHVVPVGVSAEPFAIHYENGPLWSRATDPAMPACTVLANFVDDIHQNSAPEGIVPGTPAIVAAPFGRGRVVLFSPHPELTPGLGHLLVSAVRWAARGPLPDGEAITWQSVFGDTGRPSRFAE
jgi:hypothetical protein